MAKYNKEKGKKAVRYTIEEEELDSREDQFVEIVIPDNEGPFRLIADKSIVLGDDASQMKKQGKKHMSGMNLLYVFIKKIMLSFTKIHIFRRSLKK